MSLWCSLLGHRFEGSEVEREREERGDEVVTVSREVELCSRCGARRVVSENTEVRTVETPPDALGDDADVDDAGGDGAAADAPATDDVEDAFEPPTDPAEEDAEILTDTDAERSPGEWPAEPGAPDDPVGDADAGTPDVDLAGGAVDATAESDPPEGTLYCSVCGFTEDAVESPLREGDNCPDCLDSYLEVR